MNKKWEDIDDKSRRDSEHLIRHVTKFPREKRGVLRITGPVDRQTGKTSFPAFSSRYISWQNF